MKLFTPRSLFLSSIIGLSLIYSCKKGELSKGIIPEESNAPVLFLNNSTGYAQNGDTVQVGHPIKFGFDAKGTDAPITNLVVKKVYPDGSYKVMMDTGTYAMEINFDKTFYQSIEDTAVWTVTVMDRNRATTKTELTVYKDPDSKFGGIIHYPSIILGYQNNTKYGQFLDLTNGKVYMQDSATIMQQLIDVVMYYYVDDRKPSPTFSSPGEVNSNKDKVSTYYPQVKTWSTKNYILWDISVDDDPVSVNDFINCHNDSLLIVQYDDVWGKMKFKWATAGRIIPFQFDNGVNKGIRGMICVIRADEVDTGSIEFEVKMQM